MKEKFLNIRLLGESTTVDAGDSTDIEAPVDISRSAAKDLFSIIAAGGKLMLYYDVTAVTGSPDLTVTDIEYSPDGGTTWISLSSSPGLQITAAGDSVEACTAAGTYAIGDTNQLRLLATVVTIDGSNSFTANINLQAGA